MALPAIESLREIRFVTPGQVSLAAALTEQTNRLLRMNETARIAPSSGPVPDGVMIEAGLGRSVDIQV